MSRHSRKAERPIDEKRLTWEIGFRIRIARDARGMTQEDLARAIGHSRVGVTNIEIGRQRTPVHVLYQIAEALDVPIARLIPSRAELARR